MTGAEFSIECIKLANLASIQAIAARRRFGRCDREAAELTRLARAWRVVGRRAAEEHRQEAPKPRA